MNTSPNANAATTTWTTQDNPLDPQEAADLLKRAQRQAHRQFTHETPLLSLAQAFVMLTVYGSIWLSVRGQHPYRGPSLGVVGYVYITVAVLILVCVASYTRATAGIRGRSRRDERIAAIPLLASIVGVYVFVGALRYDGFSNAIVYGVVDAAAPWIVVGAVLAGLAAAKEDWWKMGAALAVILIGTGSSFAGPIDVWAVLATCGCLIFLGQAVLRFKWSRQA
jgi:hypothetical protein